MPREKRKQREMFDEFMEVAFLVKHLSGIVQNDGVQSSDEEILEWSEQVNNAINKLSSLREDVIRFYQD